METIISEAEEYKSRLLAEIHRFSRKPVEGIVIMYDTENDGSLSCDASLHRWNCIISTHDGTQHEIELFFPPEYPMQPPRARFLSEISHPNVDKRGIVHLSVLEEDWSPARSFSARR